MSHHIEQPSKVLFYIEPVRSVVSSVFWADLNSFIISCGKRVHVHNNYQRTRQKRLIQACLLYTVVFWLCKKSQLPRKNGLPAQKRKNCFVSLCGCGKPYGTTRWQLNALLLTSALFLFVWRVWQPNFHTQPNIEAMLKSPRCGVTTCRARQ